MYVCGITPYDTTHLGHAFTYIHFDVLNRHLAFLGYKVNYVQNVTDIDDDMLKKAKEEGKNWKKLGDFWTKQFLKDMKNLNVVPPTHYVKATNSIPTMIRIAAVLLSKGYAYNSGGNIYFRAKKFKDYGKLSKYNQDEMEKLLAERGGDPSDPKKENPLDFILWSGKARSGFAEQDEPSWNPPAGGSLSAGRPGWHIECSAMIKEFLGDQIDIHGGGADLIFPHHESEIAQSESFTGKRPFVKYFLHTAMVRYQKEKMSKSLGNLILVKNLLKKYCGNEIRWAILSHHYRSSWKFNVNDLDKARRVLAVISSLPYSGAKPDMKKLSNFFEYLNNDLNTKAALSEAVKLAGNKENSSSVRAALYILGFDLR